MCVGKGVYAIHNKHSSNTIAQEIAVKEEATN